MYIYRIKFDNVFKLKPRHIDASDFIEKNSEEVMNSNKMFHNGPKHKVCEIEVIKNLKSWFELKKT